MPSRPRAAGALGRIVASADFERVLARRSCATTPHFALHHLEGEPLLGGAAGIKAEQAQLSTIEGRERAQPVEDSRLDDLGAAAVRIGAVVPKRHARRAVTRSLLKRQIYAAVARQRRHLAPGLWIVRLRAPFDRATFTSAASTALRVAVRGELDALLGRAATQHLS